MRGRGVSQHAMLHQRKSVKRQFLRNRMLLLLLKSLSKFVTVCRSGYANKAKSKTVTNWGNCVKVSITRYKYYRKVLLGNFQCQSDVCLVGHLPYYIKQSHQFWFLTGIDMPNYVSKVKVTASLCNCVYTNFYQVNGVIVTQALRVLAMGVMQIQILSQILSLLSPLLI